MNLPTTTFSQLEREAKLIMFASGLLAISFFGIQMLLSVLYILRLGYSVEYVGLFNAAGSFTYILSSLPAGEVGNRLGLRMAMFLGGILTVLGMALLPTTEFVPEPLRALWPILSQAVVTMGWALISINQVPALMAATTVQNRNSAYALNSVLRGLGTFTGTIVGGFLPVLFAYLLGTSIEGPVPYRAALLTGALLSLASLIPLFRFPHIAPTHRTAQAQADTPFPRWLVVVLVLHVFLGQMGAAACQSFCSAYMDTKLALSPATIGLLTSVGQFTTILAPLLAPRLAMRYGNGWTLMAATLGMALSVIPLALFPHWAAAGTGRLGLLALGALWMPALQVYQMEQVASRWRSLTFGIVSMAIGFTYTTVSFGGGYLVASWGYNTLFAVSIGCSMIGAAFMGWLIKQPSLHKQEIRS